MISKSSRKEVVLKTASFFVFQENADIDLEKAKELFKKRKFTEAFELTLKLNEEFQTAKNEDGVIETSFLLGKILERTGNNSDAISYFKKVIKLSYRRSLDNVGYSLNEEYLVKGLLNLAGNYQKNNELDSSKVYYSKLINLEYISATFQNTKAKAYNNLASLYAQGGDFKKSEAYFKEAIKIHSINKDKISESGAIGNLANLYLIKEDYEESKRLYLKAIGLIEGMETTKAMTFKEDLYFNLAYAMYKLKDYKAYEFQEKSYIIKDTLIEIDRQTMIKEISERYNFKAQKKIFEKEEEIKRAKLERNNWVIAITGVVIAMSIIFLSKLRQKNLKLKLAQTEFENRAAVEKVKSETQIQILNATIDAKEEERKEIAEVLHDNVSTLLSSANLHLQASQKQFKENAPAEIQKTKEIILEASQKVRNLSHSLISSVLLKFGLEYAIKDMVKKYSNSELSIETAVENFSRQEQKWEIKLYNVIQELINNIIKHSKATYAILSIYEKDEKLIIKIKDNGVGFVKDAKTLKNGIGLNQIDARIQMMKGTFTIESKNKKGTLITIIVPSKPKIKLATFG